MGCLENDDFRLPEAQLQLQHDPDLLGNQRADRSACHEVTLLSQSLYGSECTRKCCRDDIMKLYREWMTGAVGREPHVGLQSSSDAPLIPNRHNKE